jgi:hypothetical protein
MLLVVMVIIWKKERLWCEMHRLSSFSLSHSLVGHSKGSREKVRCQYLSFEIHLMFLLLFCFFLPLTHNLSSYKRERLVSSLQDRMISFKSISFKILSSNSAPIIHVFSFVCSNMHV